MQLKISLLPDCIVLTGGMRIYKRQAPHHGVHQVPALGHHPKWFSSRETQCIQYPLSGYLHSLLLAVFQSSSGPQLWRNLAFLASVQDGWAYQMSFLSLIDNDNKSKAITYKILSSQMLLDECWHSRLPSQTFQILFLTFWLELSVRLGKKPRFIMDPCCLFVFFFYFIILIFLRQNTAWFTLKKWSFNSVLAQFSLRVWGEVGNALKQHLCRQHVNDTEVRFISLTPWLMDFLQSTYTHIHTRSSLSP